MFPGYSYVFFLYLTITCCHRVSSLVIGNSVNQEYQHKSIEECNHLPLEEGQVNSYIDENGQRCCMCPIGTFRFGNCNVHDPNSTICNPCPNGTYVDSPAHNQPECYKYRTTSCMSNMYLIDGTATSDARCACKEGYIRRRRFCRKIKKNTLSSTTSFLSTTTTTPKLTSESETTVKNAEHITDSYEESTTDSIEVLEHMKSNSLNSNVDSFDQATGTTGVDIQYEKIVPDSVPPVIVVIILLVIGLLVYLFRHDLLKIFNCDHRIAHNVPPEILTRNNSCSSTDEIPAVFTKEAGENSSLLGDENKNGGTIEASTNTEIEMIKDTSGAFNRNGVAVEILTHAGNGMIENTAAAFSQNRNNLNAGVEPPQDAVIARQGRQQECVHCNRQQRHNPENAPRNRLTEEEDTLRKKVFLALANQITSGDLAKVGRTLLLQHHVEFEDIYKNMQNDQFNKAFEIFHRAAQLNPGLQLEDLRKIFENYQLGYLNDILDDKIRELRAVGD